MTLYYNSTFIIYKLLNLANPHIRTKTKQKGNNKQ